MTPSNSVPNLYVVTNVIKDGHVVGTKKQLMRPALFLYTDLKQVYERIYSSNCSESYCYPRRNMRVFSKAHQEAYKKFIEEGGILLYARYNKMD